MSKGALEFFLKVIRRICSQLDLPVAIGFTALGQRVGGGQSVDELCRTVEGWKSWNFEERERARSSEEFLLPVCLDPEGRGSNDWVLAVVTGVEAGERLRVGRSLHVRVVDRFGRAHAAQTVARKLQMLIGGVGARTGDDDVQVETEVSPPCDGNQESIFLVLGLLLARVARRAGVSAMDSKVPTFVRDVRRALCAAFAAMRAQADASGHRDVHHDLVTEASCRALLETLVTRPALPETVRGRAGTSGLAKSGATAEGGTDRLKPLRVLTWNVSQTGVNPVSARAPEDRHVWSIEENLAAVQAEVLRHRPDVVALQECPAVSSLGRLSGEFELLGASRSHCGYVHLYARRELGATAVELKANLKRP